SLLHINVRAKMMVRFARRWSLLCGCLAVATAVSWLGAVAAARRGQAEPARLADMFLKGLPSTSGLCVHLGVQDGSLAVGLTGDGKHLVHGLALQTEAVERARSTIESAGLAGVASVEHGSLTKLPYADNLVNLLVADRLPELSGQ